MKKVFFASVAAATLFAAPALAQNAIGSVGGAYMHNDTEGFDTDGALLDASVATPAFGDWTVTFNASAVYADSDFGDETMASGAVHLTRMFGQDVRAGGFIGLTDVGGENDFSIGGEIQKYLPRSTLTGLVAYTDADGADVWSLAGDAAFYATPALRLNAGLSYHNIDAGGGDADVWSLGLGAEYEFTGTPFSLTGGYERTEIEGGPDSDTFMIGLRYSFGGGQQARDRAGANLGRTIGGVKALTGASF